MSDIQTVWGPGFASDWAMAGPMLAEDAGLQTAVIISLFTDRHADDDDALPGDPQDKRGWWGDAFPVVGGDAIGSKLWLLERSKASSAAAARAEQYAADALAWLLEDGVARAVNVTAEAQPGAGGVGAILALQVEILRSDKPPAQFRFDKFWGSV